MSDDLHPPSIDPINDPDPLTTHTTPPRRILLTGSAGVK